MRDAVLLNIVFEIVALKASCDRASASLAERINRLRANEGAK